MIARLKGTVCDKVSHVIVLDVSGVGYEINVTPQVSSGLVVGAEEVLLTIYTDVRENAITLYGFNSQLERQTFLLLKKVKGIGSKIALSVLSSLRPEDLMLAIGNSDVTALTTVPGIGRKGAERIIVELREQVGELAMEMSSPLSSEIVVTRSNISGNLYVSDATLAMEKLGFSEEKSRHAVMEVVKNHPKVNNAGDMVKLALSYLG